MLHGLSEIISQHLPAIQTLQLQTSVDPNAKDGAQENPSGF